MNIITKQIASFPTSTYHTARYDAETLYVAGSDWDRRNVKKTSGLHSAGGALFRVKSGNISSYPMDTDMLYIAEVLSPELLFLGAKTHHHAFQLFSVEEERVIKQVHDTQGGGCYGTLFNKDGNELIMNTRNGYLQIVDVESLEIKQSARLTPDGNRLWQIDYDAKNGVIYSSDYLGTVYKIDKDTLDVIQQINLQDLYNHFDNHGNPPSVWGLSHQNGTIVCGDRFGGITLLDETLSIQNHWRMKKDESVVSDPLTECVSSEMGSIMSTKMLDDNSFLWGSRWGNVFYGTTNGTFKKIIDVPMGIQKENSAFTMERIHHADHIEVLITFGDGLVYSVEYRV